MGKPDTPFVVACSIVRIDATTTLEQAVRWQCEIEQRYDALFCDSVPIWTWDDIHERDRDALVELQEIIRCATTKTSLDMSLLGAFN